MVVTNIDAVPGKKIIEHFGIVQGSTVRARHVGADIGASFKNFVGGELRSYTRLLDDARGESMQRMIQQAEKFGANAIINMRYSTSSITQGASELLCYGTAVRVE